LHKDRDKNIKCKAYFAEFGQSECAYFTINETSNKQVFISKYGPNIIEMRKCLHKVFTLHTWASEGFFPLGGR